MRWVTVDDMYDNVKGTDNKLLSSFNADFWNEYKTNSTYYDRLFRRMFGSFRYFDQVPLDNRSEKTPWLINEVQTEFTDAVYDHLLANSKKYAELYRVNVVDDEKYSILNNYDITETKEEDRSATGTDNVGARTDTDNNVYGPSTNSVSRVEGQREDVREIVTGGREDEDTIQQGEQENSRLNKIAGFNSANFSNDNQSSETLGQRDDTITHTQGTQTDTDTLTKGAMTTTDTEQRGSKTDALSHTQGAQANTFTHDDSSEYTLRRVGNIGVRTMTEVMGQHKDFWNMWEFYTYIFKEICAELLLI